LKASGRGAGGFLKVPSESKRLEAEPVVQSLGLPDVLVSVFFKDFSAHEARINDPYQTRLGLLAAKASLGAMLKSEQDDLDVIWAQVEERRGLLKELLYRLENILSRRDVA